MHAAVLLSVATGLRLGELVRLSWGDVDLERARLTVMISKNDKARTVYLPSVVIEALRALKRLPVVGTHVICDEEGQAVNNDFIERRWSTLRTEVGLGLPLARSAPHVRVATRTAGREPVRNWQRVGAQVP